RPVSQPRSTTRKEIYPRILLKRLLFHVGIQEAGWMTAIDQASHLFGRLVGKPDRVRQTATKMGHCWAHGVRKAAIVFD
ncbi:MAG: hypothetical protein O2931_02620, partial [Planctomycetota bacterium]|nr:hypothetical protein [Planctomycetota bacterium]